ncbi:hypothetical protein M422DRAFT_135512, partial [Sphaerobolus stellatus SS14]
NLMIQDRYRVFLRATRFWAYLQSEKRSGQALNIKPHLPKAYQQSYAVLCPACPLPGINLDSSWQDDADKR